MMFAFSRNLRNEAMIRRVLPILLFAVIFSLAACADPVKYTSRKAPLCGKPSAAVKGVPYSRLSESNCAVAIVPFDTAVWIEAPFNSHKSRGRKTIDLGCKPLTPATDNCIDCEMPGHANTLMVNFDPSVYHDDISVKRAILAVYSPNNPQGLCDVILRGRLNVGDELVNLAKNREGVFHVSQEEIRDGWVFYDISKFVARAINERRNSIHFELSVPCQSPADNLVTVGVTKNEPRLVVEYK